MSKAVLVMDMPENCKDCIMSIQSQEKHTGQFCLRCIYTPTIMIDKSGEKTDWCPLRPLPEKKEKYSLMGDNSAGRVDGFNDCIDEILGGQF